MPAMNMMGDGSTTPVSTELTVSGGEGLTYSPLGFPYTYSDRSDVPYYTIGADALVRTTEGLESVGEWNDIGIAWGRERNGIGRGALLRELREDIRLFGHVVRWSTPPVVRVAHGTPDHLIGYVHFAVSMINSALPPDFQLGFDFQPAAAGADAYVPGEIMVTFAPSNDWPSNVQIRDALGVSHRNVAADGQFITAPVWVDADGSDRAGVLKRVIGHEILHSLGRAHPIDLYGRTDTIMSYDHHDLPHMLFQLDQEMLLAVYGRLEAGTTAAGLANDLGPWSDTSTNLLGYLAMPDHPSSSIEPDAVIFGVRMLNGRAMPWVVGPEPLTWIWDNPALSGSANWSGLLVGFTPSTQPVGGAAEMVLDLGSLGGSVDFTQLEYWTAGRAPSAPGTGSMWGDGDLHYTVQVSDYNGDAFGNYTPGESDDYGILDGGFFGPGHEAVAGVLERDDLTATFGAQLQ